MAIDWEKSLKKYISKKFEEKMGFPLPFDSIEKIEMNFDLDLTKLELKDLGLIYSLLIMMEKYEKAQTVDDEIKKRNCSIKINIDENHREGTIDIYKQSKPDIASVEIKMIVTPEGMMVDWEKQNF